MSVENYESWTIEDLEQKCNEKEFLFCKAYLVTFNGTKAAIAAGYKESSARTAGYRLLRKPYIKAYIEKAKDNLGRVLEITAARNLNELKKIAYFSMPSFALGEMTLDNFQNLTEEQKSVIAEFNIVKRSTKEGEITIVKFKVYDKLKAIEVINKMLGYNAVVKAETTVHIEQPLFGEDID